MCNHRERHLNELLKKEDFDEPPDDLEECFIVMEQKCRDATVRALAVADNNNDLAQIVMLDYMAVVSAAAAECGVADLSYEAGDRIWSEYEDFSRAVQGLVARIRIRKRGKRADAEAVQLTMSAKAKIEVQISKLRTVIAQSDLHIDQKQSIDKKLDELLNDVRNSPKLGFGKTFATLAFLTASIAGLTTISADGPQAIQNIMRILGVEKRTEDEAMKRLAPPQKLLTASVEAKENNTSGKLEHPLIDKLDSDIPS